MIINAGLAARFANIASLEEMSYGALKWWSPLVEPFARAVERGDIL